MENVCVVSDYYTGIKKNIFKIIYLKQSTNNKCKTHKGKMCPTKSKVCYIMVRGHEYRFV